MKIKIHVLLVVCVFLAVYANQTRADVNDHVLHIEMSMSYKFGTTSTTPTEYCFDAWMKVDDTVESGSVQPPGSDPCDAWFEIDGEDIWLGIGFHSDDLSDLDDFVDGTYTFTVNYTGGGSDSTTVEYSLEDGNPIPPVTEPLNTNYPVNGAVGVPLAISFDLVPLSNPDWIYNISYEPVFEDPNARRGEMSMLPYTTESVGPIILSNGVLYDVDLNVGHEIWSINDDGISYVVDKDSERSLSFTTISDNHLFITNSDINYDRYVNLFDFAIMADDWLEFK